MGIHKWHDKQYDETWCFEHLDNGAWKVYHEAFNNCIGFYSSLQKAIKSYFKHMAEYRPQYVIITESEFQAQLSHKDGKIIFADKWNDKTWTWDTEDKLRFELRRMDYYILPDSEPEKEDKKTYHAPIDFHDFLDDMQAHVNYDDSMSYTYFAVWPDGKFTTFRDKDTYDLRMQVQNSGIPLGKGWK